MQLLDLNEIIEWNVYNWSRSLEFWQKYSSLELAKVNAPEIGARRGGLSLWLSALCRTVHCTDVTNIENNARTFQLI